jgi:hypothetical protein
VHKKNNWYHEGTKQIPYVLHYGQPYCVDLSRTNLSPGLMQKVTTEGELQEAMDQAAILVTTLNNE